MTDIRAAMGFEWVKLRTLRSTYLNLALYFLVSLVVSLLTGYYLRTTYDGLSAEAQASLDPVASGFGGLRLGLIALVAFGVIIVSSEYSSGTVRSSLAAVPRRGVFYWSKVLTGTLTAFVVSVFVVVVTFFATQAAMGGAPSVSLTDDGVVRAMVGAVLYTTLLCAFAMGLASLLRSSALTIGILLPLFFILSTILTSIPGVRTVAQFLPDVAGGQILYREPQPDTVLTPWTGMAVLVAWTAVSLAAGYLAVRRRDA